MTEIINEPDSYHLDSSRHIAANGVHERIEFLNNVITVLAIETRNSKKDENEELKVVLLAFRRHRQRTIILYQHLMSDPRIIDPSGLWKGFKRGE